MKRTKTKILSVFLSFCIIISCMVGISVPAGAGDVTEWYIGDTIDLGSKWFCCDDDLLALGSENASSNLTLNYNGTENKYQTSEISVSQLYYNDDDYNHGPTTIPIFISRPGNQAIAPIGIKVKNGTGTKESPYQFDLIYPKDYTSGGCTVFYDQVKQTITVKKTDGGDGKMADYNAAGDVLWKENIGNVEKIDIQYGVTYIGDNAFVGNSSTTINIPSSVTYIGDKAFLSAGSPEQTVSFTRPNAEQQLQIKGAPFNSSCCTLRYSGGTGDKYALFDGTADIEDDASSDRLCNADSDIVKVFNWKLAPFDITIAETEHGSVAASVGENTVTKAEKDAVITLNVTPDTDYVLKSITVTSPREGITEFKDLVAVMGDKVYNANADYMDDFDDYYCKTEDGKFVVYNGENENVAELSADNVKEFYPNHREGAEVYVVAQNGNDWYFVIKDTKIKKITVYNANDKKLFQSHDNLSTGSVLPDVFTLTTVTEGSEYKFTMPKKTVTVTAEFELHTHSFTYALSEDGKTITAACGEEVCTLPDKQASLTISAPTSLTYDRTEKAAAITGDTAVLGNPDITYKKGSETLIGAPTESGTYTASITVGGVTASVEYTIAAKEITVSGIAANDKTYDGKTDAQLDYSGATITGKIEADDLTVTATGAFEDANAGTGKTVTISGLTLGGADAGNYVLAASGQQTDTTADITAKSINGATVTLNKTQLEYTGSEQTVSVTVVTLDEKALTTSDYDVSGELSGTAKNTYTVTVTGKGNYKDSAEATWEITAKQMTVSAEDVNVTYDGTAHGITVVVTDPASGYTIKYGESADACTLDASPTLINVGTKTVYYKVTADDYADCTGSAAIAISAAPLTITAKDQSFSYTGSAQGENNATYTTGFDSKVTVSGLQGDDALTSITLNGQETNVGVYAGKIVASEAVIGTATGNYDITYNAGKLTISKASITPTIEITGTYTYTGSAITPTFTVKNGETELAATDYTASVTDNVNAGTGKITVTAKADGNYTFDAAEQTFSIGKATWTNTTARGYVKQNCSATIDLAANIAAGGTLGAPSSGTLSGTKLTFTDNGGAVGTDETVTVAVTYATNYENYTITATFTVTDKDTQTLTFGKDSLSVQYGDTAKNTVSGAHTALTYESDKESVATVAADGTVTAMSIGTAKITVKAAESAEYAAAEASYTVTVTRKAATVTADSKTKVEGETDPTLTATVSGLVSNDTITYTISRAAGEAVGTYTITPSGDAEQGNYTVTYKTGTLTIKAKTVAVTSVTLDRTTAELKVNEKLTLTATVKPDNATDKTVTWTSDAPAVAMVTNGVVTAVSAGNATITATVGGKSASCVVTVKASGGNGGGGYTPYYPSYPTGGSTTTTTTTTTNNNEPKIEGGSGASGWSNIASEISKIKEGGSVTVDMAGATTVPASVLNAVKGKDVDVVLDMGGGVTWTINGKDISSVSGGIDLGVKLGTSDIPAEVKNNVTGEKYNTTLHLNHSGAFGFKAVMTVPLRKQDAGLFANLFYYNPLKKALEFVSSAKIDKNGNADLDFNHASDYAIIVDDHPMDKDNGMSAKPTATGLRLAWNPVDGATSYNVYVKKNGKYKKLTSTSKPALKVSGLKNGTTYEFMVRYKVDGKLSEIAESYTLTVNANFKPNVTLKANKGKITVKWDKIEGATKYQIYKYVNGKLKLLGDTTGSSIRLTGTKAGKKYTIAVKALVNGKWTTVTKSDLVSVKAK